MYDLADYGTIEQTAVNCSLRRYGRINLIIGSASGVALMGLEKVDFCGTPEVSVELLLDISELPRTWHRTPS
jgi:hypothetical protein